MGEVKKIDMRDKTSALVKYGRGEPIELKRDSSYLFILGDRTDDVVFDEFWESIQNLDLGPEQILIRGTIEVKEMTEEFREQLRRELFPEEYTEEEEKVETVLEPGDPAGSTG